MLSYNIFNSNNFIFGFSVIMVYTLTVKGVYSELESVAASILKF